MTMLRGMFVTSITVSGQHFLLAHNPIYQQSVMSVHCVHDEFDRKLPLK
ncbi:MAG: hypothetical protein ACI9D5_002542 [Candidatus Endobugula sp.]|jgi:hypothetical protein